LVGESNFGDYSMRLLKVGFPGLRAFAES
jgi:hypothetical protein